MEVPHPGAWRDVPDRYGSWATLHTRFRRWAKDGTFDGEWPTGFGLARRHATNMLLAGHRVEVLDLPVEQGHPAQSAVGREVQPHAARQPGRGLARAYHSGRLDAAAHEGDPQRGDHDPLPDLHSVPSPVRRRGSRSLNTATRCGPSAPSATSIVPPCSRAFSSAIAVPRPLPCPLSSAAPRVRAASAL
ncbi:transposase [Streptomyces sp. NBC_00873]|uniref:transposase n=1 Tax=Streptomyces sp. NBC_00873 TaxID=2975852 RepID=UPI00386C4FD5